MSSEFAARLMAINETVLTPLVRRSLQNESLELIDWTYHQIHGGVTHVVGLGFGVYRFSGHAQSRKQRRHWSLILKTYSGVTAGSSQDPSHWLYWKRDSLAYASGVLEQLPGQLRAPGCFGVIEQSADEHWLWLEDIQETADTRWPLARFGIAARHLGQFNGGYLVDRAVPGEPWLTRGRIRTYLALSEPVLQNLYALRENRWVDQCLSREDAERILRLWQEQETYLHALDQLPRCLCHHDAHRRNLLAYRTKEGEEETVAIDWSLLGTGAIGEEIATLVAGSLRWLDVDAVDAHRLDHLVFQNYLAGLREAGWQGDEKIVRLGYVTAVAFFGLFGTVGLFLPNIKEEEQHPLLEQVLGHPLAEVIAQYSRMIPFLLELSDEATQLLVD